MPIEKQSLNNFLPNGFETLNQEGYKENFSEDKIKTGYEKDVPDIVSGPNFNNLIDVVGKNTNTLNSYVEYLNGMPINNVPTVNEFNQLDYTNLDDKLTKKQITNCILEIPQRIKYTLENGTLTIKTGSVVIVPYGTEDLTSQYPKGATFINDNFRVYDTQFHDGKFFVWAELVGDVVVTDNGTTSTDNYLRSFCLDISTNSYILLATTGSGTGYTGTVSNVLYYNTSKNIMERYDASTVVDSNVRSLPIMMFRAQNSLYLGKLENVFNGMGYIGSTLWVDKGVKGLIPNGRNEDGTFKNEIGQTTRIYMQTDPFGASDSNYAAMFLFARDEIVGVNEGLGLAYKYIVSTDEPQQAHITWYNPQTNLILYKSSITDAWVQRKMTPCMFVKYDFESGTKKNTFISLTPKRPFRAIDYSDKSEVSGWGMPSTKYINLTVGTSQSSYTAPANGWVNFSIVCNAGNSYCDLLTYTNEGTLYNFVTSKSNFNSAGQYLGVIVPVRKGQQFKIQYGNKQTNHLFTFIYAEGEV